MLPSYYSRQRDFNSARDTKTWLSRTLFLFSVYIAATFYWLAYNGEEAYVLLGLTLLAMVASALADVDEPRCYRLQLSVPPATLGVGLGLLLPIGTILVGVEIIVANAHHQPAAVSDDGEPRRAVVVWLTVGLIAVSSAVEVILVRLRLTGVS